jgi:hypothetical protein
LRRSGLNPEPIVQLWDQHRSRVTHAEPQLWAVLMYQSWFARYEQSSPAYKLQ